MVAIRTVGKSTVPTVPTRSEPSTNLSDPNKDYGRDGRDNKMRNDFMNLSRGPEDSYEGGPAPQRKGRYEDIPGTAVFLASEAAIMIT